MNVTDDIVTRLRGTLPADGTLVSEYDRLCAHAAHIIEALRLDVEEWRRLADTAEADADRLAGLLRRYATHSTFAPALDAHDEAVKARG